MAGLKIKGDTSGSTTITAPNTGTDETIELSSALASKLDLEGGKILQIVRATDGTERSTTSTSFTDITGMSITITPQKSDSTILIMVIVQAATSSTDDGNNTVRLQITDSSNNALSGADNMIGGPVNYTGTSSRVSYVPMTLVGYSTPATTSATTYKVRFRTGNTNATASVQNQQIAGQLYAIEVSA